MFVIWKSQVVWHSWRNNSNHFLFHQCKEPFCCQSFSVWTWKNSYWWRKDSLVAQNVSRDLYYPIIWSEVILEKNRSTAYSVTKNLQSKKPKETCWWRRIQLLTLWQEIYSYCRKAIDLHAMWQGHVTSKIVTFDAVNNVLSLFGWWKNMKGVMLVKIHSAAHNVTRDLQRWKASNGHLSKSKVICNHITEILSKRNMKE